MDREKDLGDHAPDVQAIFIRVFTIDAHYAILPGLVTLLRK
jgi:hypothetical protein